MHTVHDVAALTRRQHRRERAQGRAGVAQEQLVLTAGQGAAEAMDDEPRSGEIPFHRHTDAGQGRHHHPHVIAVQQIFCHGHAMGQRSEQEHAVGQAFRAGQGDHTLDPADRFKSQPLGAHFPSPKDSEVNSASSKDSRVIASPGR